MLLIYIYLLSVNVIITQNTGKYYVTVSQCKINKYPHR